MQATLEAIDNFCTFAREKLASQGAEFTFDDLYQNWKSQREHDETVQEIQLGIEQIERGEGLSINDVDCQIRHDLDSVSAKHDVPTRYFSQSFIGS